MRGNVTLYIAIGPFVKMTFERPPSLGRIGPFVGLYYEIGPFGEIGSFVGIGLIGGTSPVVSLTDIIVMSREIENKQMIYVSKKLFKLKS